VVAFNPRSAFLPSNTNEPSTFGSVLQFPVFLEPPDVDPWVAGNTGVPGFVTRESGRPGPHVALIALTHGNELAGAIVLDRLLRRGLSPWRGTLTFGFANLAAFARFDRRQPTASRFIDEDMNRLWDDRVLKAARRSCELDRAREIQPLIASMDVLLDLHSMLWPSDPLILCGGSPKGRARALAIGQPELVVADPGHASGRRLIDYAPFTDPETTNTAVLVEAGQHWDHETVEMTLAAVAGLLSNLGLADADALQAAGLPKPPGCKPGPGRPRYAEVTSVVTAATSGFAFVRPFRGGEVIPRRGTLLALDGTEEIRTPHDDCLLVMPSLRPGKGHTAIRLGRFVDAGSNAISHR
jgi:predicted deacylase